MRSSIRSALRSLATRAYAAPHREASASLTGAALFLLLLTLITRWLSVTCVPGVPCVTLSGLRAGAALPEALHIYDRFGHHLADVDGPLRWSLPPDRLPHDLGAAWVGVEDRRFWSDDGVDLRGIVRAAALDLSTGRIEEGASTIPMQLVRTLWGASLDRMGRWRRKIVEARTAPILVSRLGHRRVLDLYLNSIYLGDGVYGVDAAARDYFGVSADSLDLAQIATLVGMTPAPELYQPRRHPHRAVRRRDLVLRVLADEGVVSRSAAAAAEREPLRTVAERPRHDLPTYATAAVQRAIGRVAPDLADRPGLRIFTTLDPVIQREGRIALRRQLAAIQAGRYGSVPRPDSGGPIEGAAVALDPSTGAVRAWIGGRDYQESQFDRVSEAHRQVGSLVKPLLVAAALERGRGILDLVSSDTISVPVHDGVWTPRDHVHDTIMPIREALIHSSNRAAVHLGLSVGVGPVRQIGEEMGIDSPIPRVPSTFLGSFDASLLDMTAAYAVFDNGGLRVRPYLIERIEDSSGRILWQHHPRAEETRVLSPATSFVVLDAMRAVVDRGTARPVRATGYDGPAAGKTGTTNGVKDAWFIGLTPQLAAGVWIGFDQPRTIARYGDGGSLAGPVWGRWIRRVQEEEGDDTLAWVPPPGVRRVRYDPSTGSAYGADCRFGPASSFRNAWVRAARYPDTKGCPGGLFRWLDAVWGAIAAHRVHAISGGGGVRR